MSAGEDLARAFTLPAGAYLDEAIFERERDRIFARTWQLSDLPPVGPHQLGRYQGVSLTVDLYLRKGS